MDNERNVRLTENLTLKTIKLLFKIHPTSFCSLTFIHSNFNIPQLETAKNVIHEHTQFTSHNKPQNIQVVFCCNLIARVEPGSLLLASLSTSLPREMFVTAMLLFFSHLLLGCKTHHKPRFTSA